MYLGYRICYALVALCFYLAVCAGTVPIFDFFPVQEEKDEQKIEKLYISSLSELQFATIEFSETGG